MKNLKLIFALLIAVFLVNSAFAQSRFYGTVTEIVDGRTIIVEPQPQVKIKIQLQYIEVPEAEQKLHAVVKNHLTNLILNKYVEFKPKNLNETTQPIGQVLLNGVDISQQMLRDGAAWYAVPEKNLQNEVESKIYRKYEALAKNEKRGVWSVEGLKPAWEFRAEKAEQKRLEEKARLEEIAKNRPQLKSNRMSAEDREKANANVRIWADVSDYGFIMSRDNMLDYIENATENLEPLTGTSPSGETFMTTRLSLMKAEYKNTKHKFFVMFGYFYKSQKSQNSENHYVLLIASKAPETKFSKAYNLTVFADKKKIASYGAGRTVDQTPSGKLEILTYGIKQQDLEKIKKAKSLSFNFGGYKGTVSETFIKKIGVVLDKLQ